MSELNGLFDIGDWIVHRHHGVGQIAGKDVKRIGEREGVYYQVAMENSTMWVPLEALEGESFRPLVDEDEFNEALTILQRPAREMADNFTKRKSRINRIEADNSFVALARILRDLWVRQRTTSLSNTEETAFRRLTKRFLNEWAVRTGVDEDEAQGRFYNLLRESHTQPVAAD
ncbi:MAG: CarD family transcriptional regulator [Candidatus Promineifilaceae bacterium]